MIDIPSHIKAVILSCEGEGLTESEEDLFTRSQPLGFILFARNCKTPEQVRALSAELRGCVGWHCPILIDQEGGRVQRLKPPVWRKYPPMRNFGDDAQEGFLSSSVIVSESKECGNPARVSGLLFESRNKNRKKQLEALHFVSMQIAQDLRDCGVDVNCAPVLDVLTEKTHDAIGDRAFSSDPEVVARLGLCVARHFLSSGVIPVIKHLPGHGRATQDSHYDLPVVDASHAELDQTDFLPFKALSKADVAPGLWGMAAHIIYKNIDPEHPSSVSPVILHDIIRKEIGFEGFLLSDDIDMKALSRYGDVEQRCVRTLEAGCDVALYCAGELRIMKKIVNSVPKLTNKSRIRLQKSLKFRTVFS